MASHNQGEILMEDASIAFRNFTGREDQYNAEGNRNFCVMLPDDLAKALEDDGWNVKALRIREEGDTPQKYLQVSIKYRGKGGVPMRPPTVVLITSLGRTSLEEEDLDMLDYADIANTDLIIRPFSWNVNGKAGIKAYLKCIYITLQENALELKYRDVPEIGRGAAAITTGKDDEDIWDADVVDEDVKAIER